MGFDEKSSYYVVLTGGGWVGTKEVDNFPLSEPRFHNFTPDRLCIYIYIYKYIYIYIYIYTLSFKKIRTFCVLQDKYKVELK